MKNLVLSTMALMLISMPIAKADTVSDIVDTMNETNTMLKTQNDKLINLLTNATEADYDAFAQTPVKDVEDLNSADLAVAIVEGLQGISAAMTALNDSMASHTAANNETQK